MPNQATVTAPVGPGKTATALVLTNINGIEYDLDAKVVRIRQDNVVKEFDISALTTVTTVITAGNWSVTIS